MNIKEKIINEVCFIRNSKPLISSKKMSHLNENFIFEIQKETSFLNEMNPSLSVRINYILYNKYSINKCAQCGKNMLNIQNKYCSHKCNNNSDETKNKFRECYLNLSDDEKKIRIKKRTETFNIKYGGYTFQVKSLNDKVKEKMFQNFGVFHSFHSEEIKNKAKKTWLINYGVDNPFKSSEIIHKIKTIIETKYGVTNSFLINNEENVKKQRNTKILRGLIIPDEFLSDFKKYSKSVRNLTRKNYLKYNEFINPENLKRVTNGNDGYQLDHKFSVFEGFINNIEVDIISHPSNLELILWSDNIRKSRHSSILIEDLTNNIKKFNQFYYDKSR
jgi:hypothetical protein